MKMLSVDNMLEIHCQWHYLLEWWYLQKSELYSLIALNFMLPKYSLEAIVLKYMIHPHLLLHKAPCSLSILLSSYIHCDSPHHNAEYWAIALCIFNP